MAHEFNFFIFQIQVQSNPQGAFYDMHMAHMIWGKLPYDDGDGNGDSATVKAWVRQERSGRWKNHPIGKFGTNLT